MKKCLMILTERKRKVVTTRRNWSSTKKFLFFIFLSYHFLFVDSPSSSSPSPHTQVTHTTATFTFRILHMCRGLAHLDLVRPERKEIFESKTALACVLVIQVTFFYLTLFHRLNSWRTWRKATKILRTVSLYIRTGTGIYMYISIRSYVSVCISPTKCFRTI